jgi:predicted PolB exonuclease-like 3'-5' exonuclease
MNEKNGQTGFVIFDIETIPDGKLIADTRYPDLNLTPDEAVLRFQDETRASSSSGSDFVPLTYHLPVAVCALKVGPDFRIQSLKCLDCPQYRTEEIVRLFWKGVDHHRACLVSFNGRAFDVPVLELAAFRQGLSIGWHFNGDGQARGPRHRFGDYHIDLLDFFTNYNAIKLHGGLNLLAKMIGLPGKVEMHGSDVYEMIRRGNQQTVNEYCTFDVLDTYFIFLRTRVLLGHLTLAQESDLRRQAQLWLQKEAVNQPHLDRYLSYWGAIVSLD